MVRGGRQLGIAAILIAGVGCRARTAPPPLGDDGCARAQPLVARATALAAEGFIERASAKLREASMTCGSPRIAHDLAELSKELELRGEAIEALLARADGAETSGKPTEARKLRDRVLVAVERERKTSARAVFAAPQDPERPAMPESFEDWIVAGTLLLSTRTGKAATLPGTKVHVDPRWILVERDDREAVTLFDLATTTPVLDIAGTATTVRFTPSGSHLLVWAKRKDSEVIAIVDLTTRYVTELPGATPHHLRVDFDDSKTRAIWTDDAGIRVLDIPTKTIRTVPTTSSESLYQRRDDVLVLSGDGLRIVRIADGSEVIRLPASTFAFSADGKTLAWSGAKDLTVVHVRDLMTRAEREVRVRPPPQDCKTGPWSWQSVDKTKLTASHCTADALSVDLVTGKAAYERPGEEELRQRHLDGFASYAESQGEASQLCSELGALDCDRQQGESSRSGNRVIFPVPGGIAEFDIPTKRVVKEYAESAYVRIDGGDDSSPRAINGGAFFAIDTTGRARLWSGETGSVVWRGPATPEPVERALFTRDGELVTLSKAATVRRWSPAGALVASHHLPRCRPAGLGVDATSRIFVACIGPKEVAVYDPTRAAPLMRVGIQDIPSGVALDRDGHVLAIVGANGSVELRSTIDPSAPTKTIAAGLPPYVESLALAGDFIAAGYDHGAKVFHVGSGAEHASVDGVAGAPSFAADASWVAFPTHRGAVAVSLDPTARRVALEFGAGMDATLGVLVDREGVIGTSKMGGAVAWRFAAPESPTPTTLRGRALAMTHDRGRIAAFERIVRVVDLRGPATDVSFAAIAYSGSGATLRADGALSLHGDAREARDLLRCAIGERLLPFSVCEGRYER